ncbi:MAG: hypothetical protein E7496_07430 [Ruminococcus sp.]|nr:hypothetical protein [Ruminococcus sp.]
MTLKERAEQVFNQLDEEELEFFLFTFESPCSEGTARKLTYSERIAMLLSKADESEETEKQKIHAKAWEKGTILWKT